MAETPPSSYPSCTLANDMPLSLSAIKTLFLNLGLQFGFQPDSVANMTEHFLVQLDSRASRMSARAALELLHADYISGPHANFRKWLFSTRIHHHSAPVHPNEESVHPKEETKSLKEETGPRGQRSEVEEWDERMLSYTPEAKTEQVAMYLLVWGEANNVRFLPETLCFIVQCLWDHHEGNGQPQQDFLHRVITPLYTFISAQQVSPLSKHSEKDHASIIGYDDINQMFWLARGLRKLRLANGSRLMDLPPAQRYAHLELVLWADSCRKLYFETRTWLHCLPNFNRIWIIHICVFWYYMAYNSQPVYTRAYDQRQDNKPQPHAVCLVLAFAGTLACVIQIAATLAEWWFVPRLRDTHPILRRTGLLALILVANFGPSVFTLGVLALDEYSLVGRLVAGAQLALSVVTVGWFSIQPLAHLFTGLRIPTFTAEIAPLSSSSHRGLVALWLCVFLAKFGESYVFLTLSLKDPVRNLATLQLSGCLGEAYFGFQLCRYQAKVTLVLIYLTGLVLFFLDTYLWYIICNCVFLVALALRLGMTVLSPWRNVYTRLPKRIYAKILSDEEHRLPRLMVSQIWNGIVISMYREHLLSAEHVRNLVYDGQRAPLFFVYQDDSALTLKDFFPVDLEAVRRVTFFAQSLATPIPEPLPVEAMPVFTVLIPHYGEKILMALKEVIREEPDLRLTLLEYLKALAPVEWDCFVRDTKSLWQAREGGTRYRQLDALPPNPPSKGDDEWTGVTTPIHLPEPLGEIAPISSDLPFYCLGFTSSTPLYTLRTRIWASLRTQTLYRTVSGFMGYHRALALLHQVESPSRASHSAVIARQKVQLLVAMQRYQRFSTAELSDTLSLRKAYPEMKIAYLEEVDGVFYSTLLETQIVNGEVVDTVRFRVRLLGNPILGDGKADNQNHALIFYRGEYIQVVDANQDHYLEECLKIRLVLREFEAEGGAPVAIVGAREYIFSQSIGALGDIAAGKEQTFGTLFARALAQIGGKLHYGHPDFLNGIFMTTRGGVSKAQKGLHLNEDIYAGMNAVARGGRIKHCDYFQCGKGRDLGFGSILNFTAKIGAGMGEQMLLREYYHLGTQLPLHRFLSFYYAHPGFHINNVFILLSVQLFMLVLVNLGALASQATVCVYSRHTPITDLQRPEGCANLQPVLQWVDRFVLSVFICFFILFAPLVVQEVCERGPGRAVKRLVCHLLSMAPVFEVFVCQIYSHSLRLNVSFGGARYIASGRGFATAREPFAALYSHYAPRSIYLGSRVLLLLLMATLSIWRPALLWFWLTVFSLCLLPFFFNPHQFARTRFFLDYREYVRWLTRGNSNDNRRSWVRYSKAYRAKYTGSKRKGEKSKKGVNEVPLAVPLIVPSVDPLAGSVGNNHNQPHLSPSGKSAKKDISPPTHFHRAPRGNLIVSELILSLCGTVCNVVAYTYLTSRNNHLHPGPSNPLLRLGLIAAAPLVLNVVTLTILGLLSCVVGPLLSVCTPRLGGVVAGVAHALALFYHLLAFELLWFLEGFNVTRTIAGFTCAVCLQRVVCKAILILFVTREMSESAPNTSYWSGVWINRGMGWRVLTQPVREFLVKVVEMTYFAMDFVLGHCLLFAMVPFLCIPYVDTWHSCLLFWLRPLATPFVTVMRSRKSQRLQRQRAFRYSLLFITVLVIFMALLLGPVLGGRFIPELVWAAVDDKAPSGLVLFPLRSPHGGGSKG